MKSEHRVIWPRAGATVVKGGGGADPQKGKKDFRCQFPLISWLVSQEACVRQGGAQRIHWDPCLILRPDPLSLSLSLSLALSASKFFPLPLCVPSPPFLWWLPLPHHLSHPAWLPHLPQQSLKAESRPLEGSATQLPILADMLLYYCRFAARPVLLQVYQTEVRSVVLFLPDPLVSYGPVPACGLLGLQHSILAPGRPRADPRGPR